MNNSTDKINPVTVTAFEFDYALKIITSTTTFARNLADENPIKAAFFLDVIFHRIKSSNLAHQTQTKLMYLSAALIKSSKHVYAIMDAQEELLVSEMANNITDLECRWDARRKLGRVYRELEKDLGHFRMQLFRECIGDAIYFMSANADKSCWTLLKNPNNLAVTFNPAPTKNRRLHSSIPFELRIAGILEAENVFIYKFPNYQTCPTLMA